jgi:hypothetical protein
MNDLRFVLAAVAVFAAAFAGMSFGMPLLSKAPSVAAVKSAPVTLDAASSPAQLPPIVEARTHVAAPLPASPEPIPAPAPARGNAGDRLAQTALQAANAYARAPCDRMAKTAFIVAASTYLRAKDMAAPDDARVHAAIKAAFETGHIGSDEFPPDLMIAGRFAAPPSSRAACVNSAGLRP